MNSYERNVGSAKEPVMQTMVQVAPGRPHEFVQRDWLHHASVTETPAETIRETPRVTKIEAPFETRFEPLTERATRVAASNEPRPVVGKPLAERKRPFAHRRTRAEMQALRAKGEVPPLKRATRH